ncbi:aminoglycoside adenylyltransferase domain-containing protein [Nocardioides sp. LHG3406-4]|uniref:aminoglycoside adenylyltransferase domain-containing protein n=1 Tax=Nocardioides sp. LHG3406-4 TaxID=2804575 RepID=UPI003CFA6CBB
MTGDLARLPAQAAAVCTTWLGCLDATVPGLVSGLYLRGGLALGEWLPGQSDVDFVATLVRRPDRVDLALLRSAHEAVLAAHPMIPFDGPHLLASDLGNDPEVCPDVPCTLGGTFYPEGRQGVDLVTWHELASGGVTVRGPAIDGLGVWTSPERLTAFTSGNLDTYWRSTAEALAAMPSEGEAEEACCWCVLGVARLDHLLVTGEMTTKSRAGRWGLTHYPARFHRVLREALRIREGGADQYPGEAKSRARDTADFTAYVVAGGTEPS